MNQEVRVPFPLRAQTWVVGSIPSEGHAAGSRSIILSQHFCFYLSSSVPSSLKSTNIYMKERISATIHVDTDKLPDAFKQWFSTGLAA